MSGTASRGSIGGASGDAGVQYRRGVAAYLAACGLAGVPIQGLAIPDLDAVPTSVALETDEPVDDIRVRFLAGWSADFQAKRALSKGPSLDKAVAQWVQAGKRDLDPDHHRLVIVTGQLSAPMRALRSVLNRRRRAEASSPTLAEAQVLKHVEGLLSSLSESQRGRVLDAATIWELAVEEAEQSGAREAVSRLHLIGIPASPNTWTLLTSVAGELARNRAGHDLAGWLTALRGVGLVLHRVGETPAAILEQRRLALHRYTCRLAREARVIDLRSLGAELPPVVLDDADALVHVGTDPDDSRSHAELLWSFLRRYRVVLTGLPGSGKSTAIRRAAGRLAHDWSTAQETGLGSAGLPLPVRVSLRDVNALGTASSFRDRLLQMANRDDPADDRGVLRQELEARLDDGNPIAIFMDALDETYIDRDRVVRELEEFLAGIPESALVLVATRDIAYAQAATLGWAELRLRKPEKSANVVRAVLDVAAQHKRIDSNEIVDWVRVRSSWVKVVLDRDPDLEGTPLIPILLTVLATTEAVDQLPTHRANVLRAIVESVLGRLEVRRSDGRLFGALDSEGRGAAVLDAFGAEARVILDHAGVAPSSAVQEAVTRVLSDQWFSETGRAREAAKAVIRFLDETGVFVLDESTGTITSRISLFAEVGDAIESTLNVGSSTAWVHMRVQQRQLEPIMLAAELSPEIRSVIERELAGRVDDIELARALTSIFHRARSMSWLASVPASGRDSVLWV